MAQQNKCGDIYHLIYYNTTLIHIWSTCSYVSLLIYKKTYVVYVMKKLYDGQHINFYKKHVFYERNMFFSFWELKMKPRI